MLMRILGAAVLAGALAACGTPAKIDHKGDPSIKQAESAKTIDLKRIVSKQGAGQHVGQLRAGLLCAGQGDLTTRGVNIDIADRDTLRVIYDELKTANYNMVGTPDDLFDNPARERADFQLAGVVSNVRGNICFPMAGFGNLRSAKGEYAATVDWQLYDRHASKVVYALSTEGTSQVKEASEDGFRQLQTGALRQATKALLADPGFRDAIAKGGVAKPAAAARPGS